MTETGSAEASSTEDEWRWLVGRPGARGMDVPAMVRRRGVGNLEALSPVPLQGDVLRVSAFCTFEGHAWEITRNKTYLVQSK
jgi:hypothetical protein